MLFVEGLSVKGSAASVAISLCVHGRSDAMASEEYKDENGNPITLDKLCRTEPAWAANQIRVAAARVDGQKQSVAVMIVDNEALTARVAELEKQHLDLINACRRFDDAYVSDPYTTELDGGELFEAWSNLNGQLGVAILSLPKV